MSTYERRTFEVEAIQLKRRTALDDGQTGEPGDWLVTYPNGAQKIMTDKAFRAEFVKKMPPSQPPRRSDDSPPWPFMPKYRLKDELTRI